MYFCPVQQRLKIIRDDQRMWGKEQDFEENLTEVINVDKHCSRCYGTGMPKPREGQLPLCPLP